MSVYRGPSLELAKANFNIRLVEIEGAGHAVHLDRPAAFLSAVRELLGEA